MSIPDNTTRRTTLFFVGMFLIIGCAEEPEPLDDGGDVIDRSTEVETGREDTGLVNSTDNAPILSAPGVLPTSKGTITAIDGLLTEELWDIITPVSHTIEGTGNNDIFFGTRWDEVYLYIGVRVMDPNRHNDSYLTWQDDSVEVYLDGDFSRGTAYDEHDIQYWLEYETNALTVTYGMPINAKHAIMTTENGYTAELAILWEDIRITPRPGMKIGFDLGINDDDDGNDRDAHYMWNGNDNNWTDTSAFGTLILQ